MNWKERSLGKPWSYIHPSTVWSINPKCFFSTQHPTLCLMQRRSSYLPGSFISYGCRGTWLWHSGTAWVALVCLLPLAPAIVFTEKGNLVLYLLFLWVNFHDTCYMEWSFLRFIFYGQRNCPRGVERPTYRSHYFLYPTTAFVGPSLSHEKDKQFPLEGYGIFIALWILFVEYQRQNEVILTLSDVINISKSKVLRNKSFLSTPFIKMS